MRVGLGGPGAGRGAIFDQAALFLLSTHRPWHALTCPLKYPKTTANAVWTRPKPPKTRNPKLRLKGMRGTQGDNTTFIIISSY